MFGLVPFGSNKNVAKRDNGFHSIFDVFNDPFFSDAFSGFGDMQAMSSTMRVDVKELSNAYELTADLPGMQKQDINLRYENNYLTIEARHDESKDEKDNSGNYIRRERRTGSVSRSFYIDNIDDSRIDAEFNDGVLKVHLPKSAEVQRTCQINIR